MSRTILTEVIDFGKIVERLLCYSGDCGGHGPHFFHEGADNMTILQTKDLKKYYGAGIPW